MSSRFNIFKVDKEYLDFCYQMMENEGELTPEMEAKFTANQGNFEFMMLQAKRFKKYAEAEIETAKAEKKRLDDIIKRYNNQIEVIKRGVENSMNLREIEKFKNDDVSIYTTTRKVLPKDITFDKVPSKYHKDPEVMKRELTQAIKNNEPDVSHIELEESKSLTIK